MRKNSSLSRSLLSLQAGFFLIFAFPASTNYQLKDFGFGSGGVDNATSTNYALDAISGEQSGGNLDGTTYDLGSGLLFTNQANVPPAPTFTNPSNYYNKLHIVVVVGGNPSDTKFVIAISTDDFVTTNYVQSDNTVGATLGSEDYQTYANWGGASGEDIIGLTPATTYKVKMKAMQGKFTETGYGPTATAATVNSTLSFNINTNSINFGSLYAGTVTDGPVSIIADFSTNAESGGNVYMSGQNGGLSSASNGYQISSATADLTSATEGFGARGTSVTQSSGGPLSIVAPYNGTSNNVGIVNASIREVFTSAAPISGGQGTLVLKAKSSAVTPSAGDYAETITVIAAGRF